MLNNYIELFRVNKYVVAENNNNKYKQIVIISDNKVEKNFSDGKEGIKQAIKYLIDLI